MARKGAYRTFMKKCMKGGGKNRMSSCARQWRRK